MDMGQSAYADTRDLTNNAQGQCTVSKENTDCWNRRNTTRNIALLTAENLALITGRAPAVGEGLSVQLSATNRAEQLPLGRLVAITRRAPAVGMAACTTYNVQPTNPAERGFVHRMIIAKAKVFYK